MTNHAKTEKKLRQLRHAVKQAIRSIEDARVPWINRRQMTDEIAAVQTNLKIALEETEP